MVTKSNAMATKFGAKLLSFMTHFRLSASPFGSHDKLVTQLALFKVSLPFTPVPAKGFMK